jgi:hypothetical protein
LAGPAGCNGNLPVPKRIQLAINHSHEGDIIVVCPGDYFGRVQIDGRTDLTVRAADPWDSQRDRACRL